MFNAFNKSVVNLNCKIKNILKPGQCVARPRSNFRWSVPSVWRQTGAASRRTSPTASRRRSWSRSKSCSLSTWPRDWPYRRWMCRRRCRCKVVKISLKWSHVIPEVEDSVRPPSGVNSNVRLISAILKLTQLL